MAAGRRVLLGSFSDSENSDLEGDIEDENTWKEVYTSPEAAYFEYKGGEEHEIGTNSLKVSATCTSDEKTIHTGPKRMELNDHKAGMEKLDKERINKIIFEASKGSRFYENELKKEARVTERIERQTSQLMRVTEEQKQEALKQADLLIKELEASRDLGRTIVHVDMDAFYAAVEIRENPSLQNKPMAVGGTGMLSTSNYEARKYGVRAAMPGFIGKKLCPDLIIVPPQFDKYREVSQQVREVLAEYDPNFVPMSLDEAYLDLTEYLGERRKDPSKRVFALKKLDPLEKPSCSNISNEHSDTEMETVEFGHGVEDVRKMRFKMEQKTHDTMEKQSSSIISNERSDTEMEIVEFGHDVEEVVREMRFKIEQKTRLTASAGIAPNAMLAKVCSDRNKPNGQFYLKPDRENVLEFVQNLSIRKISGIGRVSEQMLRALGIEKCADLYTKRDVLYLLHSQISCRFLLRVSLGLGETRLEGGGPRKSLGTETTFSEISQPHELRKVCEKLCQDVVKTLKSEGLKAKTVTLKLKTVTFEVKVRSQSFPSHVSSFEEIFPATRELLCNEIKSCQPKPLRLRLMGVRLSSFRACDLSDQIRDIRQDTITSFLSSNKQKSKHSASTSYHVSGNSESVNVKFLQPCVVSPHGEGKCDAFSVHLDNTSASEHVSCSGFGTDSSQSNVNPTVSSGDQQEAVEQASCPQRIDLSTANKPCLVCPVCGEEQTSSNGEYLLEFNRHVDLCLSKSAIKEMLSKDKELSAEQNLAEQRERDSQVNSRKRRKPGSHGSSKKITLHKFWAK